MVHISHFEAGGDAARTSVALVCRPLSAAQVRRDLQRKMVFVAGPRQVGKTTLARQVLGRGAGYLKWDVAMDRERILKGELPLSRLWVFEEAHKYRS